VYPDVASHISYELGETSSLWHLTYWSADL